MECHMLGCTVVRHTYKSGTGKCNQVFHVVIKELAKCTTGQKFILMGKWDTLAGINNNIYTVHYNVVILSAMASQITGSPIVCSIVGSDADQGKHQGSASLAFVRGIHRSPVNSPHKRPVTRKMFPFDDVIMVVLKRKMIGSCVKLKSLDLALGKR